MKITGRKPGRLKHGQANGIACRFMEMFQAFGFADKIAKKGDSVNEITIWRADEEGNGLTHANRMRDVEDDLSEMPHVILSLARVRDSIPPP